MSYLIDADWIIQGLRGHPQTLRSLEHLIPGGVSISLITMGEIFEGAYRTNNPEAHLEGFRVFFHRYRILGIDEPIMMRFAEIRAFLRRRGEPIDDFDILLGATALEFDLTILTYNLRHLRRIPDVKIYQTG